MANRQACQPFDGWIAETRRKWRSNLDPDRIDTAAGRLSRGVDWNSGRPCYGSAL